jgi:hypothetical protein
VILFAGFASRGFALKASAVEPGVRVELDVRHGARGHHAGLHPRLPPAPYRLANTPATTVTTLTAADTAATLRQIAGTIKCS